VKKRLDQLLLELNLFKSRREAQSAIMNNEIKIGGKIISKAGFEINYENLLEELKKNPNYIELKKKNSSYVSRGAEKLKAAYENFELNFENILAIDLGASTGGFTDFMLQHGAKKVIAIDVGKAQLDYKLREHPRVLNLEGINFRYIEKSQLNLVENGFIDLVTCDLSFISIEKILDKILEILVDSPKLVDLVFLIKPQFEAGKKIVDKCKGVIKDPEIREEVLKNTLSKIKAKGFEYIRHIESPIKGAKGNIEYLAYFKFNPLNS
jgi:23S rRNA (cytidine1920-2'-O)/16S rRNA (cytidine1409-2'-O)-methyltransferase